MLSVKVINITNSGDDEGDDDDDDDDDDIGIESMLIGCTSFEKK